MKCAIEFDIIDEAVSNLFGEKKLSTLNFKEEKSFVETGNMEKTSRMSYRLNFMNFTHEKLRVFAADAVNEQCDEIQN